MDGPKPQQNRTTEARGYRERGVGWQTTGYIKRPDTKLAKLLKPQEIKLMHVAYPLAISGQTSTVCMNPNSPVEIFTGEQCSKC